MSEFALKIMEEGNIHEKEIVSRMSVVEVTEMDEGRGVEETLRLMEEGTPLIYQGWLEKRVGDVVYRGRPDLLEGRSEFGEWIETYLHSLQSSFFSCRSLPGGVD